jgi:CDP-diacylglycerol--serine O-phosphatidyltransferase
MTDSHPPQNTGGEGSPRQRKRLLARRRRERVPLAGGVGRARRVARPHMVAVLPTLLSLGNAICGFGSVTFAIQAEQGAIGGDYLDEMFRAGLLVFAAMVFDLLDGQVARLTKRSSNFGKQLDSLCDVVSFGVAPAMIVLRFSYHYHPRFLWVVAVLYLVALVLRLARFNSEAPADTPTQYFSGLPSPAAAGMIASLVVAIPATTRLAEYGPGGLRKTVGEWLILAASISLPLIALMVAWLMVSRVRYPHPDRWLRKRRTFPDLVTLVFVLVIVSAGHELAVPLILMYFVLTPPLRAAHARLTRRSDRLPPTPPEASASSGP